MANWLGIMHKIKAGTPLDDAERYSVWSVHEAMTGRGQIGGGINADLLWCMLGAPEPEVYQRREPESTPHDQP